VLFGIEYCSAIAKVGFPKKRARVERTLEVPVEEWLGAAAEP
jgi:hypothetical protein